VASNGVANLRSHLHSRQYRAKAELPNLGNARVRQQRYSFSLFVSDDLGEIMKLLTLRLFVLSAVVGLSACSPKLQTPEGYPTLYVSPDNSNVLVFAKPHLDLSAYRSIHIDPITVKLPADAAGDADQVASYLDAQLRANLSKSFTLVDQPGPDVLRLRFSVVGAEPTSKAQMVMMVPPFSMVNMVSPKGAFIGSVTIGGEVFEGTAKEASAAFLVYGSRPGIDATVQFRRWDAAKKVIDKFAERLAEDLELLRKTD
jgi:hypothetical protein